MAEIKDNRTMFQKLTDVVIGLNANSKPTLTTQSVTYNMTPKDTVLYSYNSKEERDAKLAELKQQRLLAYQWKKSSYSIPFIRISKNDNPSSLYIGIIHKMYHQTFYIL